MSLIFALILTTAAGQQTSAQHQVPIEVFQILELPISISDTGLVETRDSYRLKCVLSNNSEFRILGLRYSLVVIDSMNVAKVVVTRNEELKLHRFQTNSLTFRTPIKLKLRGGERLVLMLEQTVSTDYVWEVNNASKALAAYIVGDYSIPPRVVRLSNLFDALPRRKMIY